MSQGFEGELPEMEDFSALMDGELDAAGTARACERWRGDAQSRADWHAYQLIGDVLRSDELASTASRDSAFLAALRVRLAEEPVVLAPASPSVSSASTARVRRSLRAPAAIAAGFMAVAGVLVVTQMRGASSGGAQPAGVLAQSGNGVVAVSVSAASSAEPAAMVMNGQLIRDVRLDEYLAAHKRFGGSSALGGPSGFLRNAAVESTGR